MKILIYILASLYALCPYDLLPDFIIGLGWIDDLAILGLVGWYYFYRKRKFSYQQNYQRYQQSREGGQQDSRQEEFFKDKTGFQTKTGAGDPYDTLGVKKTASFNEIKASYRRLANQYHPDKVSHLGEEFRALAEKRFKEIQEAYQELKIHK